MKIPLLLLTVSLVSCLPNRLVPYDYAIAKNNLEASVEFDSVTVSLTNLEVKNDHYVFGLEIQNNGALPVFLSTDNLVKYAHYQSYREEKGHKSLQEVATAMSPTKINQFFEQKKKDAQAAATLLVLLGAAASIYDAVQDVKDNSKEDWTKKDEKRSMTRDLATSATLFTTDILTEAAIVSQEKATTELRYLPDELFLKDVIYSGDTHYGKILFRRYGELHRHHRIIFSIWDRDLLFDFRNATSTEKQYLLNYGY